MEVRGVKSVVSLFLTFFGERDARRPMDDFVDVGYGYAGRENQVLDDFEWMMTHTMLTL